MLKAAKSGYQSPADVNSPSFVPELLHPVRDERRDISTEKLNHSYNNSRSESRQRDVSETRPAERRREDSSLTPTRGDRDKIPGKKDNRRQEVGKPSAEFVTKTHQRIENKTKKPNLARLNNTTFDENSGIGNRLKSPNVSVSPVPRREAAHDIRDRVERELGRSVELEQSGSTEPKYQKPTLPRKYLSTRSRRSTTVELAKTIIDTMVERVHHQWQSLELTNIA